MSSLKNVERHNRAQQTINANIEYKVPVGLVYYKGMWVSTRRIWYCLMPKLNNLEDYR